MAKFGDILRQLRTENELTQGELAKRLGLSTSAIGMYERERGNRILKSSKKSLPISA